TFHNYKITLCITHIASYTSLFRAYNPSTSLSYWRTIHLLRNNRSRLATSSSAATIPPSPEVMFLVGYNENIANVPNVPTICPCQEAPCAWAASSNSNSPCRWAICPNAPISAGCPYRCTGMIARVRSVTAASTETGSRQNVPGSISANTGRAPANTTELAVAAKVNEGTITSSPTPTPAANKPKCSPDVPELTATHPRPAVNSAANSS